MAWLGLDISKNTTTTRAPSGANNEGSASEKNDSHLAHSHEELVIFETPSPVLVAHPIHLVIVLARNEQNAPNKSWVVIFWVQLWGGDVQGALLRKTIKQLWIFWEEIHVVHCDVVATLAGLFEANIDEGGSVEPPVISLIEIFRTRKWFGHQPD